MSTRNNGGRHRRERQQRQAELDQLATRNPFDGRLMTCSLCGATARSRPGQPTNWRCIEVVRDRGRQDYWVCPLELPKDGATKEQYADAYVRIFERLGLKFDADTIFGMTGHA